MKLNLDLIQPYLTDAIDGNDDFGMLTNEAFACLVS